MDIVHEADDSKPDLIVALKFLPSHLNAATIGATLWNGTTVFINSIAELPK
jgi:hypothetical protein